MFPLCCVERPSREPWGTRKYEKKRFQKMLTCETFLMQSRCLKSIKRMDNARQLLMCALFRTRVERVHPRLGNYSNAPSYSRALDLSTYIVQWVFQARETYTFHSSQLSFDWTLCKRSYISRSVNSKLLKMIRDDRFDQTLTSSDTSKLCYT